ncbi:MAG: hypothetical protein ABIM44_04495 [candidate division WOR-3 bacterium]
MKSLSCDINLIGISRIRLDMKTACIPLKDSRIFGAQRANERGLQKVFCFVGYGSIVYNFKACKKF